MAFLKQSTAVTVLLGPFVDKTDGVTEETGLASTGTELSKAGGAFAAGPTLGTHDSDGWYPVALTTTHTNTLGALVIKVHDSATHLPVWQEHMVLTANVYDSLVGGTDVLDVSTTQFNGSAVVQSGGRPEVNMTHIAGAAVSTSTAQLGVNAVQAGGTAWGSGAITAASIATGAVDADALAADAVTEIWAGSTAPSAATIADSVWDEDATGHQTTGTFGQAIGDPGADTDTIWSLVNANLDATVSSRATQTSVNTIDDFLDTEIAAIKAVTDALPNAGALTTIQADLDNIQTRLPTALVGGRMDASVGAMAADTLTASALAADAVTEIWAGSTAPSSGSIANAVWDLDATAHQTQGTFGQVLGDSGADTDSVWGLVNTNLNATVSSRASQTSVDAVDDFLDTEIAAIKAVTDVLPNGGALTTIQADLDNIQTRLPAALVGGRIDASVGAMAADTLTASALATDAVTEIWAASTAGSQASVDAVKAVVDAILVDTTEIGVAGAGLTNINLPNQTMDITGDLIGNVTGSVGSVTGDVGGVAANGITATSLDASVGIELADALLKRDMSSVSGEAARSPLNALRFLRNKWSIAAGTLTVTEEDDTTTAWTAALTTSAGADPIIATDPT